MLISPDISVPVFRARAGRIGHLPQPFLIFASERDWTLRPLELVSGQRTRLGNIERTEALSSLDVTLADVTAFEGSRTEHSVTARSPALLRILRALPELKAAFGHPEASPVGLLPGAIAMIGDATEVIPTLGAPAR